jgi:nitrile hydratase beta subunit
MNGAHDLGGMMGFGPVRPETNEPCFHGEWEKRALAVTLACGALGQWTLDESRHARETIPPAQYLSKSYYDIWITALEKLLLRHGLVTPDELKAGDARTPRPATRNPPLPAARVAAVLAKGSPTERAIDTAPRFAIGDRVTTKVMHPQTHTRLPRYARGKTGIVTFWHGAHVFPDTHAHGLGEQPAHCYGIAFSARELWGEGADPSLSVMVDCWEPYLESAA